MDIAHTGMRDARSSSELKGWRMIYTNSCIVRGLAQSIFGSQLTAISTLDRAIIIAGPCGPAKLDLILSIIEKIQSFLTLGHKRTASLPPVIHSTSFLPQSSPATITCIDAPSFLTFQSTFSKFPFIVRNYARNWPAMNNHPWKSATYLRSIAGPGRIVPVEIGHDYRSTDWKQDLMEWDNFLLTLDFEDQPSCGPSEDLLYLAQHDLTKQFPTLREDIIVPDYVYASLFSGDSPRYRPPNNDDQIIFNTWLGPKNAMSPAHTVCLCRLYILKAIFEASHLRIPITTAMVCPSHFQKSTHPVIKDRLIVQVVGCKSVWLAPPSATSSMYPFTPGISDGLPNERLPSSEIGNTSQVDVFAEAKDLKQYPAFVQQVVPTSMTAALAPGDLLYFPPGWWHAMRSEMTSLSFSMWF